MGPDFGKTRRHSIASIKLFILFLWPQVFILVAMSPEVSHFGFSIPLLEVIWGLTEVVISLFPPLSQHCSFALFKCLPFLWLCLRLPFFVVCTLPQLILPVILIYESDEFLSFSLSPNPSTYIPNHHLGISTCAGNSKVIFLRINSCFTPNSQGKKANAKIKNKSTPSPKPNNSFSPSVLSFLKWKRPLSTIKMSFRFRVNWHLLTASNHICHLHKTNGFPLSLKCNPKALELPQAPGLSLPSSVQASPGWLWPSHFLSGLLFQVQVPIPLRDLAFHSSLAMNPFCIVPLEV